jgi:hypothetical protein
MRPANRWRRATLALQWAPPTSILRSSCQAQSALGSIFSPIADSTWKLWPYANLSSAAIRLSPRCSCPLAPKIITCARSRPIAARILAPVDREMNRSSHASTLCAWRRRGPYSPTKTGCFPSKPTERVWWEVWLREGRREAFERIAQALNITLRAHAVRFPEREVVLALSEVATLDRLVAHSDVVAELRRAKDTPSFFMGLGGAEQRAWSAELLNRLAPPGDVNVAVCLLDSGVHRTHPLIEPVLAELDWHTINPAWGADDTPAHGRRQPLWRSGCRADG